MPLLTHVSNLEAHGITITSADDPAFDATIRALFTGDSKELLKLMPLIVVISNHSTRTMVAYTLTWVLMLPHGTRTSHVHCKYPNAVSGAFPVRGK
jgi:hypothetical protein